MIFAEHVKAIYYPISLKRDVFSDSLEKWQRWKYNRKCYTLRFRVIKFAIFENSYEYIITNLPIEEFSTDEIRKVYTMRYGIKTSFLELKYAIGLSCFHSKKVEYIEQEIYSAVLTLK